MKTLTAFLKGLFVGCLYLIGYGMIFYAACDIMERATAFYQEVQETNKSLVLLQSDIRDIKNVLQAMMDVNQADEGTTHNAHAF